MRKQSLRMGKLPAECGFLLREFVLILSTLFAAVAFALYPGAGDINRDGIVNGTDLAIVLGNWS